MTHLDLERAVPFLRAQVDILDNVIDSQWSVATFGHLACEGFLLVPESDTKAPKLELEQGALTSAADVNDPRYIDRTYRGAGFLARHLHVLADSLEEHPHLPVSAAWSTFDEVKPTIHMSLHDPGRDPGRMMTLMALQGYCVEPDGVRVRFTYPFVDPTYTVHYSFAAPPFSQ